jgi:Plasmid pRiA4b ORF-3-like protein
MSTGRVTAKTKIFEFKIELREVRPAVLRRVQVPAEITLAGLHQVVQVAMGWTCPASSSWQDFGLGKVGDARVGQADVDVVGPVPGQGLVRADGVVVDPVALGVHGQVEDVVDLLEEQPLVLQRPEAALA